MLKIISRILSSSISLFVLSVVLLIAFGGLFYADGKVKKSVDRLHNLRINAERILTADLRSTTAVRMSASLQSDRLPINRALTPTPHQLLIRELILQLKEGHVSAKPFREKFGVDILREFARPLRNQQAAGYLEVDGDEVRLTRRGLLQVDSLLPEYFEKQHRAVRYT